MPFKIRKFESHIAGCIFRNMEARHYMCDRRQRSCTLNGNQSI